MIRNSGHHRLESPQQNDAADAPLVVGVGSLWLGRANILSSQISAGERPAECLSYVRHKECMRVRTQGGVDLIPLAQPRTFASWLRCEGSVRTPWLPRTSNDVTMV